MQRGQSNIQNNTTFNVPLSVDKTASKLADQVFEILQQRIVTGELRPNERLVELVIANKLGIGRTPVREALKRLHATGYARMLESGKLVVVEWSGGQIKNLFDIREALECMAIRLACQRVTEEQIREAEEYHTVCIEMAAKRDHEQYCTLNRQFHEQLYAACGNEELLSLIRTFRYQYFDLRLIYLFSPRDWKREITQHSRILEALRKRDENRAVTAVQRHMRSIRQYSAFQLL